MIGAENPVTCVMHARENDFLDKSGWTRFKCLTKREKKLLQPSNQAKLHSYLTSTKQKLRNKVPHVG